MPTPDDFPPSKRKPPMTGIGVAIFAIGLLILVPSGLCVGVLGIGGVAESISTGSAYDAAEFLTEVLTFGIAPIFVGSLLVWIGWRLREKT